MLLLYCLLCLVSGAMSDSAIALPPKSKNYVHPQLRNQAVQKVLNEQKSVEDTSDWLGISDKSIKKYVARFRTTGTVLTAEELKKQSDPKYKRPHRRHKIDTLCSILLRSLVFEFPQITLDELRQHCSDFGYDLSKSGIHYYLESMEITYKVISRVESQNAYNAAFSSLSLSPSLCPCFL